ILIFEDVSNGSSNWNPVRCSWDYMRNADGSIQGLPVTSAVRPSVSLGSGYVDFDVTLPAGFSVANYTHAADGTVYLDIAQPSDAQTFPPWHPGGTVRVTSIDPHIPSGDYTVDSTDANLDRSQYFGLHYNDGNNIVSSVTGATGITVTSHGCGATGEGEFLDLFSTDPNFPAT